MANTNTNPTQSPTQGPSASASDNITLRIVVLAHGNRSEDDLYLVLSLQTTVAQLKVQIQQGLTQHPAPDTQRLIYQGRPLLDGEARLQDILRVDQRTGNASHVMHLVVRDQGPAHPSQTTPALPQPIPRQPGLVQMQQFPQQTHIQLPGGLPHDAHMRIHNQLHNMQHHMQHTQALRASQARAQPLQAQPNQIRAGAFPQPGMLPHHTPPVLNVNDQPPAVQTPQLAGGSTRIEERIGPNGEHIRTVIESNGNTSSTTMRFQIAGLNVPNPLDRPSSAPGSSPPANSDPANRATTTAAPNIQIHPHPPQLPAGFPFPPGMQLPLPIPTVMPSFYPSMNTSLSSSQAPTTAWLLSSPQGPQGIVFAPGHGFFSSLPSISALPSVTQVNPLQPQPTPTVPTTVIQPDAALPQAQAQLVVRPPDSVARVQGSGGPAPPQPGARPQAQGAQPQLAQQPAAAPARQDQPAQNENNDLVQFLITRGWLFLRLYMFVFILSESGTWRRMIMLASAIIFCLLPRENPLTNAFQVARQHFDNLIGPPNIPPRQPQPQAPPQAQGQDAQPQRTGQRADNNSATEQPETGASSGSRARSTPMPTPEEAARRLLEQQNRRNPNPVLDLLWRIEQGVVLFLASLIPGLGERHIQAREQARRILDEEETRAREESERNSQPEPGAVGESAADESHIDQKDSGPLPESWNTPGNSQGAGEASSSGVDRNAGHGDQGVRQRGGG